MIEAMSAKHSGCAVACRRFPSGLGRGLFREHGFGAGRRLGFGAGFGTGAGLGFDAGRSFAHRPAAHVPGLLPLLLMLLAVVAAPAARAQTAAGTAPVYNVEMIVFAVASGPAQREDWTAAGARLARGGESGEGAAGGAQVGRFGGLLPPAQYQLNELRTKLAASGTWRPIAHVAWSQSASSWGSRAGFSLQQLGLRIPGLSGSVFLERGTYLHLGMSLKYAAGEGRAAYDLTEIRRVKFYDKNYYDHPAFGVIAVVTPAGGARAPGR